MGGLSRNIGRLAITAVTLIAPLVAEATPVSAATAFRGFTWFHDGQIYKTGPSGSVVSAFATGAPPNTSFKLRMAATEQEEVCSDIGATDINANVRFSNSRGFIATTAGVANQPPGEYDICFYQIPLGPTGHRVATLPVILTIV